MAARRPLTVVSGSVKELVSGDTLQFGDATAQSTAMGVRSSLVHTSASIANNVIDNSALTVVPGFQLWKVTTDRAARIRIYDTSAHRTSDATRTIGADPSGNHGLLFELITTASILTYSLTPHVDFHSTDASSNFFVAVTNLSGSTSTVATTYYYLRTE